MSINCFSSKDKRRIWTTGLVASKADGRTVKFFPTRHKSLNGPVRNVCGTFLFCSHLCQMVAVSVQVLRGEKINEKQKIPSLTPLPGPGKLIKGLCHVCSFCDSSEQTSYTKECNFRNLSITGHPSHPNRIISQTFFAIQVRNGTFF